MNISVRFDMVVCQASGSRGMTLARLPQMFRARTALDCDWKNKYGPVFEVTLLCIPSTTTPN